MFVPVTISVGDSQGHRTAYSRGLDLVGEKLTAFQRHAADMREPLGTIGRGLIDIVGGQFNTEGSTGATGHWAPLSPEYGAWKAKHAPGLPLLVGIRPTGSKGQRPQTYARSGKMRMQLLNPESLHVSATRLLYAPDSDIAGYHETGTDKMPARPPVDPRLTDLRSFDRVFSGWIAGLVREVGL